jgi:hypothetical protein
VPKIDLVSRATRLEVVPFPVKAYRMEFHSSLRGTTRKPDVSLLAAKKEGQCAEGFCK